VITDLIVGNLRLKESDFRDFNEKPSDIGGGRVASLAGVIVGAGPALRDVEVAQQNLLGLYNQMVPVVFTQKTDWNGYYYVTAVDATMTRWAPEQTGKVEWTMELTLAGFQNDIDLESRLGGPLTITNGFSATGERWHAPPIGHTAYWTGASSPSQLTRTGAEGAIKVYRDVPVGVSPRWSCPPASYLAGRCRVLDAQGYERTGTSIRIPATGWTVQNGLVSLAATGSTETLRLGYNFGSGWAYKAIDLRVADVDLGLPVAVTLMRNDVENVTIRLLWDVTPSGRITADIQLRRGSRFFDVYMKSMSAVKLGIHPGVAEAATNGSGFITSTAADADGNKFTAGSPIAYTADTTSGGLSKSSTTVLDGYIGITKSADGTDTAALMYKHFLGAATERVIGVRL
jgi:hypothetical protein